MAFFDYLLSHDIMFSRLIYFTEYAGTSFLVIAE